MSRAFDDVIVKQLDKHGYCLQLCDTLLPAEPILGQRYGQTFAQGYLKASHQMFLRASVTCRRDHSGVAAAYPIKTDNNTEMTAAESETSVDRSLHLVSMVTKIQMSVFHTTPSEGSWSLS